MAFTRDLGIVLLDGFECCEGLCSCLLQGLVGSQDVNFLIEDLRRMLICAGAWLLSNTELCGLRLQTSSVGNLFGLVPCTVPSIL